MLRRAALLVALALAPAAHAQKAPNWPLGYVPSPAEWASTFGGKQDQFSAPLNVFIGSAGPGYANLANASGVAKMLAMGNIGLYQHANGNSDVGAAVMSVMRKVWGLAGKAGDQSVGEVGAPVPVDSGYLAFFNGSYPVQVNMNVDPGSGTYTAGSGDLIPGRTYGVYFTSADVAAHKASISAAIAAGARSVVIFITPNSGAEDLDDPFATSGYWAPVRQLMQFSGGIALDVPPTYWKIRGAPYQSMIRQILAYAQGLGYRASLTVSPSAQFADAAGNIGPCGYDPAMMTNLAALVADTAAAPPTQWVVEAYGSAGPGCGTENDVATDATPNSLNAAALYLASTARTRPLATTTAAANGVSEAQTLTSRIRPQHLSDLDGGGTLRGMNSDAASITGGTITGNVGMTLNLPPLLLGGLIIQGNAGAFVFTADGSGHNLTMYHAGGVASAFSVTDGAGTPRVTLDGDGGVLRAIEVIATAGLLVPIGSPGTHTCQTPGFLQVDDSGIYVCGTDLVERRSPLTTNWP